MQTPSELVRIQMRLLHIRKYPESPLYFKDFRVFSFFIQEVTKNLFASFFKSYVIIYLYNSTVGCDKMAFKQLEVDFTECPRDGLVYGGSDKKFGIIYNNEHYMIKFSDEIPDFKRNSNNSSYSNNGLLPARILSLRDIYSRNLKILKMHLY